MRKQTIILFMSKKSRHIQTLTIDGDVNDAIINALDHEHGAENVRVVGADDLWKSMHVRGLRDDWSRNRAREDLSRLQAITEGCRPDMHEPNEQGLEATIHEGHLDNAMGDEPGQGEIVVELSVDGEKVGGVKEFFNLANLIALARRAVIR